MFKENAQDETKELAAYVKGFADANQNPKLARAAEWLETQRTLRSIRYSTSLAPQR